MDKLSVNPGKVRGLGNICDEKNVEDVSLLYSNLFSLDRTIIGGHNLKVFRMNYVNDDLYFSTYPSAVLSGVNYSFSVTAAGSGSVELFVDDVSMGTASVVSGVASFSNISFSTAGVHTVYASKGGVKSNSLYVTVRSLGSINILEELWITKDKTGNLFLRLLDSDNNSVGVVSASAIVNDESIVLSTDEDGVAGFDFVGKGYDSSVNISIGDVSSSTIIHDGLIVLRDGGWLDCDDYMFVDLHKQKGINQSIIGGNLNWVNSGFQLENYKPINSAYESEIHYVYGGTDIIYDLNGNITSGTVGPLRFGTGVVEFTYKSGTGTVPLGFTTLDTNMHISFNLQYNKNYNRFETQVKKNGSNASYTDNGSLNSGDKFRVVFEADSVSWYKNGVLVRSLSRDSENLAMGFRVGAGVTTYAYSVYDDFKISSLTPSQ